LGCKGHRHITSAAPQLTFVPQPEVTCSAELVTALSLELKWGVFSSWSHLSHWDCKCLHILLQTGSERADRMSPANHFTQAMKLQKIS
jgi:hypothetical protein